MTHFSDSDNDLLQAMGPGAADKAIRDAIQLCWMSLPKEKRSLTELQNFVNRLLERAFRDLHDDEQSLRGT